MNSRSWEKRPTWHVEMVEGGPGWQSKAQLPATKSGKARGWRGGEEGRYGELRAGLKQWLHVLSFLPCFLEYYCFDSFYYCFDSFKIYSFLFYSHWCFDMGIGSLGTGIPVSFERACGC